MRALRYNGPDDVELVDAPVPDVRRDEALVRVEVSAICGSEVYAPPGTNPGHEAAGIVERAPSDSGWRTGERVGISAISGCGSCEPCRRGVQLHCANGCRGSSGMHADYVAVPASALRRLPAGVSARDGVLITGDALGVPVRAWNRVPSSAGDLVLVVGLGPVGLGHTLVRAFLGSEVVAIEPSEYRRQLALTLGARVALPPDAVLDAAPKLVIECTGRPECIALALDVVQAAGTVFQSGECPSIEFSPSDVLIRREVTYTGAWYYADEDYPEMVRLYEDGIRADRMVTHAFRADEVADAYRCFFSRRSGKVLVLWT